VLQTHQKYLFILLYFLYKDINSRFQQLVDFTCVDYYLKNKRFNLLYSLLSALFHNRVFVKCFIEELDSVYSMIYLFPNISWYEREVWDMFGIHFVKNRHLRRLLLDYGFIGHPFRKDFPLTGFVEVAYSYFFSSVVQKRVNLSQSFRKFDTNTVWNKLNLTQQSYLEK